MDQASRDFALEVLNEAKNITLATIRPDGYPQATLVNFVNEGLAIYVGVGQDSQKANNVRHSEKVSLTVNGKFSDWQHVHSLSMGGHAEIVSDAAEIARIEAAMDAKFPDIGEWAHSDPNHPLVFLKISPTVVSLLNYEKGVGHAELEVV